MGLQKSKEDKNLKTLREVNSVLESVDIEQVLKMGHWICHLFGQ